MKRAIHGHTTDFPRAGYGHTKDFPRAGYGQETDGQRASNGRSTAIVLSRDACRAGGCVFVSCSFCVRSSFGRFLWGVRLVLVRVAFVRGGSQGEAADCGRRRVHLRTWDWSLRDTRRTLHGPATDLRRTSDGRRTGGHSSDADILRHSEMGGGAAADCTRTRHGHATGGTRACLRTSDGRATGGHRSDLDKPSRAKMGGGATDGLSTGGTRAGNGRHTDEARNGNGRQMDLPTGF